MPDGGSPRKQMICKRCGREWQVIETDTSDTCYQCQPKERAMTHPTHNLEPVEFDGIQTYSCQWCGAGAYSDEAGAECLKIDDAVQAWHDGDDKRTLQEYLGMSTEAYGLWLKGASDE